MAKKITNKQKTNKRIIQVQMSLSQTLARDTCPSAHRAVELIHGLPSSKSCKASERVNAPARPTNKINLEMNPLYKNVVQRITRSPST